MNLGNIEGFLCIIFSGIWQGGTDRYILLRLLHQAVFRPPEVDVRPVVLGECESKYFCVIPGFAQNDAALHARKGCSLTLHDVVNNLIAH